MDSSTDFPQTHRPVLASYSNEEPLEIRAAEVYEQLLRMENSPLDTQILCEEWFEYFLTEKLNIPIPEHDLSLIDEIARLAGGVEITVATGELRWCLKNPQFWESAPWWCVSTYTAVPGNWDYFEEKLVSSGHVDPETLPVAIIRELVLDALDDFPAYFKEKQLLTIKELTDWLGDFGVCIEPDDLVDMLCEYSGEPLMVKVHGDTPVSLSRFGEWGFDRPKQQPKRAHFEDEPDHSLAPYDPYDADTKYDYESAYGAQILAEEDEEEGHDYKWD